MYLGKNVTVFIRDGIFKHRKGDCITLMMN